MPSILTLQGPNLALLGAGNGVGCVGCGVTPLAGSVAVIKAHPVMLVVGFVVGVHLAMKNWHPKDTFSAVWGEQRASQARDRAFHGPKRHRKRGR